MRRFSTVRLDGARPRHAGAINTARVATETKLVSEVTRVITTAWTKLGRPFFVAPVPMPDGVLEAWAIPRATKARHLATGGDVAYVRSADGRAHRHRGDGDTDRDAHDTGPRIADCVNGRHQRTARLDRRSGKSARQSSTRTASES